MPAEMPFTDDELLAIEFALRFTLSHDRTYVSRRLTELKLRFEVCEELDRPPGELELTRLARRVRDERVGRIRFTIADEFDLERAVVKSIEEGNR